MSGRPLKSISPLESRIGQLRDLYDRYERESAGFRADAVCRSGCALCCKGRGPIHIVTLEGVVIRKRLTAMPRTARRELEKAIAADLRKRANGKPSQCPFLARNDTCRIYEVRPFICRKLYSLRECGETGPTVHRAAVAGGEQYVQKIREIDETGYSGHISRILDLLAMPAFRELYEGGGFDPAGIEAYGRKHGIAINRFAGKTVVAGRIIDAGPAAGEGT